MYKTWAFEAECVENDQVNVHKTWVAHYGGKIEFSRTNRKNSLWEVTFRVSVDVLHRMGVCPSTFLVNGPSD
mgnify:FL=1